MPRWPGHVVTQETKDLIKIRTKAAMARPEVIAKIQPTQFKKDSKPWNTGLTVETSPKMAQLILKSSAKRKGKPTWMKGRHHTEEAKEKNRQAHLGSHPNISAEALAARGVKISIAQKGVPRLYARKPHTAEWNKRLSESNTGKKRSEETKAKLKIRVAERWNNPDYVKHFQDIRRGKLTDIERILGHYLMHEYPDAIIEREYIVDRLFLDFAIADLKIDFEADGAYWHNRPDAKLNNYKRDKWLENHGWKIRRFSDKWLYAWKKGHKLSMPQCTIYWS